MRDVVAPRNLDALIVRRETDLERLRIAPRYGIDIGLQFGVARLTQYFDQAAALKIRRRQIQRLLIRLVGKTVALVAVDVGDEHRHVVGVDADASLAVADRLGR